MTHGDGNPALSSCSINKPALTLSVIMKCNYQHPPNSAYNFPLSHVKS